MTKKEAAEFLAISVKMLEKYMAQQRITFSHIKGKYGDVVDFAQEELDRFKQEMGKGKVVVSPAIVKTDSSTTATNATNATTPNTSTTLTTKEDNVHISTKDFMGILEKIARELKHNNKQLNTTPLDQLSFKLALSLEETALLSGFPLGIIKRAIKEGSLKAVKVGRVRRVKTLDLDSWIKHL